MFHSTVCTIKNTVSPLKPNEDAFYVDDEKKIYIIADGVSRDLIDGYYPNPSPSKEVADIFVEEASRYVKHAITVMPNYRQAVYDAFAYANHKIKRYNSEYTSFFPGTVGVITLLINDTIYYGYIGDCTGILLNDRQKKQFTHCQTKQIYIHRNEFSKSTIRSQICNNPSHPYSYGVIDGRDAAMEFVVTGEFPISEYSGMILHSDGATEKVNALSASELLSMTANCVLNVPTIDNNKDDKSLILVKLR